MGQFILSIDIGTSACKIAVFNRKGEVIASVNEGYPVYYPQPGFIEQKPDEWWEAACRMSGWRVSAGAALNAD